MRNKIDYYPQATQLNDVQVSRSGGIPWLNCLVWYYRQCQHTDGESFSFKTCKFYLLLTLIQGELQHKMVKHRFAHTSKRRYLSQLATAEVCERFIQHIAQCLVARARRLQIKTCRMRPRKRAHANTGDEEGEESLDTTTCYILADSTREGENLLGCVYTNRTDVALKV